MDRCEKLKEAQRRCRYRSAAFTAATPSAAAAPPQLFQQHALHLVEAPREQQVWDFAFFSNHPDI